jgi:phosphatidylglycerophosphatase A
MRRLILFLASNAGLGFSPWAPGTVGTLAGLPVFFLLADLTPAAYLLFWSLLLILACGVCHRAGLILGIADDGRIVIDELVGYLVTVAFLPFSWTAALLGFIFFRLFDIAKVFPASWLDRRMKNGIGVVLDDVVAGLYGAVALRICLALLG